MTSLFVPLADDVTLSNGDMVSFSGDVHLVTQVVFTNTDIFMSLYVNLVRVQGTSATTGMTYLLVGAANMDLGSVGQPPGPPTIPELSFSFSLVTLGAPPDPFQPPNPNLPIFLRTFTFGCLEPGRAAGRGRSWAPRRASERLTAGRGRRPGPAAPSPTEPRVARCRGEEARHLGAARAAHGARSEPARSRLGAVSRAGPGSRPASAASAGPPG